MGFPAYPLVFETSTAPRRRQALLDGKNRIRIRLALTRNGVENLPAGPLWSLSIRHGPVTALKGASADECGRVDPAAPGGVLEHCPNCGAELKITDAILVRPSIERILRHFSLQIRASPRSPAHDPVLREGAYADLLLVEGNSLERIELLADPDKHLRMIMKDGRIYKNTLK